FAGFYLNEIVLRLCPLEEAMPQTFEQYQLTLLQLQQLSSHENPDLFLRQILRQFEHILLAELGYAIDFSIDSSQKEILPQQFYQFQVTEGFAPVVQASRSSLSGKAILSMLNYEQGQDFSHEQLQLLGKLYRQMITSLLGDRPLKSRQLWIQNTQTQS
ncbi:MAG: DNA repair protein RecO C-terminal domain-containing protein, partial [Acinetobacter baumannii]|nr:DNA repair protein RecO C-terminal domain-containing protein [Acinetobacter baumannii]